MVWGKPDESTTSTVTAATSLAALNTDSAAAKDPEDMDIFGSVVPVDHVELEGVALLQIVKHCHESLPTRVAGALLGMETGAHALEVTNSFPTPLHGDRKHESDAYQMEMMKNLREVGMDDNKVGWYQSVVSATFCTTALIEAQIQYQQSLGPNAICLLLDTTETTKGQLGIKAFRLKRAFFDAYKAGVFTKESFAKDDIRSTTLLEELPISIHNADLVHCYLQQLVQVNDTISTTSFDRLDLATNAYLETSLKNMSLWADELAQEHFKFQGYERALAKQRLAYQQWQARQREENRIREEQGEPLLPEEDPDFFKSVHQPSRLEALLITKQMNTYCEHINRYAGKSCQKLFLASKFHKQE